MPLDVDAIAPATLGLKEIRVIVTVAGMPVLTGPPARTRHQAARVVEQEFAR